MGSHAALIAKVESAQEGSRELDAHICCAMSTEDGPFFNPFLGEDGSWYVQAGIGGWQMKHGDFPHYTTDLQDAVDLVPEGWNWEIMRWVQSAGKVVGDASVAKDMDSTPFEGKAWSPALALCVAILRAVEAGDG